MLLCANFNELELALLLHIDTALEQASVFLSYYGKVITSKQSTEQKNHASFIQVAIKELLAEAKESLQNINAVSVVNGPGSYTGLRVGLATAKGICYAINKPLITLNTLDLMALSLINNSNKIVTNNENNLPILFCPLIDARRMEVFTALYNINLQALIPPTAMVLNEQSFETELKNNIIIFNGNGHLKLKQVLNNTNAVFTSVNYNFSTIITAAENKYTQSSFADIAYSEPFYIKEFYSTAHHKK